MIVSPYRTSVTTAHQDDNKRVAPSLVNGKAADKPRRHALWLRRTAEKKSA